MKRPKPYRETREEIPGLFKLFDRVGIELKDILRNLNRTLKKSRELRKEFRKAS